MGLDIYLYAESEVEGKKLPKDLAVMLDQKGEVNSYTRYLVGYWRRLTSLAKRFDYEDQYIQKKDMYEIVEEIYSGEFVSKEDEEHFKDDKADLQFQLDYTASLFKSLLATKDYDFYISFSY